MGVLKYWKYGFGKGSTYRIPQYRSYRSSSPRTSLESRMACPKLRSERQSQAQCTEASSSISTWPPLCTFDLCLTTAMRITPTIIITWQQNCWVSNNLLKRSQFSACILSLHKFYREWHLMKKEKRLERATNAWPTSSRMSRERSEWAYRWYRTADKAANSSSAVGTRTSGNGDKQCPGALHLLQTKRTVTRSNPAEESVPCSERYAQAWARLLAYNYSHNLLLREPLSQLARLVVVAQVELQRKLPPPRPQQDKASRDNNNGPSQWLENSQGSSSRLTALHLLDPRWLLNFPTILQPPFCTSIPREMPQRWRKYHLLDLPEPHLHQ